MDELQFRAWSELTSGWKGEHLDDAQKSVHARWCARRVLHLWEAPERIARLLDSAKKRSAKTQEGTLMTSFWLRRAHHLPMGGAAALAASMASAAAGCAVDALTYRRPEHVNGAWGGTRWVALAAIGLDTVGGEPDTPRRMLQDIELTWSFPDTPAYWEVLGASDAAMAAARAEINGQERAALDIKRWAEATPKDAERLVADGADPWIGRECAYALSMGTQMVRACSALVRASAASIRKEDLW